MLQYQYRLPFFSKRLCGLSDPCGTRRSRAGGGNAVAAAAVTTVKPLGPGRGTAQPEFRAPRADRPERI